MKKILITGANSYVGTNVEKWLMKEPDKYYVQTLDMKNPNWKEFDFSGFDVVFHVAGLVHIKEKKQNRDKYYLINRDLAYETAKKAKNEGVEHFIFLSTMSVFGMKKGVISSNTVPKPKNAYGKSKLEAEILISKLKNNKFSISIIRPPMIYGYKSPGNYVKLSKIAKKIKVFPNIDNKRSIIFIFNFCEFVKNIIDNSYYGTFHPQNKEYVSTSKLVYYISKNNNKLIHFTKIFNFLIINFFNRFITTKVFSDLYYDFSLNKIDYDYNIYDLEKSIKLAEGGIDNE